MSSPVEKLPAAGDAGDITALGEFRATRIAGRSREETADRVAEETPVALVCNGEPHVVMLATPRDLEDFAIGFALSEAYIQSPTDVSFLEITPCPQGIQIHLRFRATPGSGPGERVRNLAGRTGCGLCGTAMIEDAVRETPRLESEIEVGMESLVAALAALPSHQSLNAATGAVHAAAWVDLAGRIIHVREDVGRHNALDKLIGALYRDPGRDLDAGFAVVTSRASYEMVSKCAFAGIAVLAAISAPTALAIRIAERSNLTLAGFARGDGCVLYAHPGRIIGGRR